MSAVWAVLAFLNPPWSSWAWCRLLRVRDRGAFLAGWLMAGGFQIGAAARAHDWAMLAGSAASLLVCAAVWWRNRRGRKRAPRAFGAKSRARLAALARKAREAARPRPVLRPAPGGAS